MVDVSSLRFLARYCKPSSVADGMPTEDAFLIRPDEEYLSVNVMPGGPGAGAGLAQVRRMLAKKRYGTSPNGRLVVFNAGRITRYLRESRGMYARIEHKPSPEDPTHAGIAPAGGRGDDAWDGLIHHMARSLSVFFERNPDSVYPAR